MNPNKVFKELFKAESNIKSKNTVDLRKQESISDRINLEEVNKYIMLYKYDIISFLLLLVLIIVFSTVFYLLYSDCVIESGVLRNFLNGGV